jgi:hypothetical protein
MVHELFRGLNVFNFEARFPEAECIRILQELGLVPTRDANCWHHCKKPMKVRNDANYSLGFRVHCANYKARNPCTKNVNPLEGTFFDGMHLSFQNVLKLMLVCQRNFGVSCK